MLIKQANNRDAIVAILTAEKLPVADLPGTLDNFFAAIENGQLAGVIGLEIHGAYGLLRSLVVLPGYRNIGLAGRLIEQLEILAASLGLQEVYLLTETAAGYFTGKHFLAITRDEVPDEIKQSSEFSHMCPVSAIVMKKSIS